MNNFKVRAEIMKAGLKYYQVAAALGITPFTLSIWLREELAGERLARVMAAIQELTKEGTAHA